MRTVYGIKGLYPYVVWFCRRSGHACGMLHGLLLAPASVHAAADVSNVGALTPFDINSALDLADYCNSTDRGDDTACIGEMDQ